MEGVFFWGEGDNGMGYGISANVGMIAYDEKNLRLYVTLHQLFRPFLLPFHRPSVALTTVLTLAPSTPPSQNHHQKPPERQTYLIKSQNDLYQVNEFVKFMSVFGILSLVVMLWQFVATGCCVLGAAVGWPVSWVEERVVGGNAERGVGEVVGG